METTDAPQIIEHLKKTLTFTPFETRWIPCSARFVLLGQHPKSTGSLQIYELKGGELNLVHEVRLFFSISNSLIQQRILKTGTKETWSQVWNVRSEFDRTTLDRDRRFRRKSSDLRFESYECSDLQCKQSSRLHYQYD